MVKQKGATLVEAIMAVFILLIVAVGGAAFIYHSTAGINIAENKREALRIANTRLEEVQSADFSEVAPPKDGLDYYLSKDGNGNWVISTIDPQEIVEINGVDLTMATKVWYDDTTVDYFRTRVEVEYRKGSSERIILNTYIGDY